MAKAQHSFLLAKKVAVVLCAIRLRNRFLLTVIFDKYISG